jgi:O-glycosyl hydrolase
MRINLKAAERMQTLRGWGASACWWAQAVSDEKTQEELAELLYGDSGLALNIYRYNIGAGYEEGNNRIENPWRRTESFMLFDREKEESSWDFSRDKNAVAVMKKSLALGNIDTLILFCNSPHYSLTSTGQASGSLIYHTCNIPKMNYRKFADYVLTVAQHFLDEGLPVKYVSPINEPQWKWGGGFVWQEGCHYELCEVKEIYHIFAEEIIKRDMPVLLYGPESGEILGTTVDYFNELYSDELIKKVMPVFAFHSYHADNSPNLRREFKRTLVEPNGDICFDMSEWCELPNKSHTRDFKGALITARIIGQDIVYAGAESWTAWVAANNLHRDEDGKDYSDAMLSGSLNFEEWTVNERFWAMVHFSKYIPVGSTALDIGYYNTDGDNDFNVFAFETPDKKTVIVTVNEGAQQELSFGCDHSHMTAVISTQNEKRRTVYDGEIKDGICIPENSIMTIILE